MAQLLGRDSVVERGAAAVDRARVAGGGTVVVCGPGGVGTSAVLEEAVRPFGTKVSRGARRGCAGRRGGSVVDRRRSADAAGRCGAPGIGHSGHFSPPFGLRYIIQRAGRTRLIIVTWLFQSAPSWRLILTRSAAREV